MYRYPLLSFALAATLIACGGKKDEDTAEPQDTADTDEVPAVFYDLAFDATDLLGPLQGKQFYLKIFGSENPNAPIAEATWLQEEGVTTFAQSFPDAIPDGTRGLVVLVWVDGDENGTCGPGDAYWQRLTGSTTDPYTADVAYTFTPDTDLSSGICVVFNG